MELWVITIKIFLLLNVNVVSTRDESAFSRLRFLNKTILQKGDTSIGKNNAPPFHQIEFFLFISPRWPVRPSVAVDRDETISRKNVIYVVSPVEREKGIMFVLSRMDHLELENT